MTLTEQWKKGELPEGFYYVKDGENIIAEYLDGYFYNNGQPMTSFSGGVDEVLTPVPSYEEWQATETSIAYNELLEENDKLKELLKEVLRHELSLKEVTELTRKISEVLGEK